MSVIVIVIVITCLFKCLASRTFLLRLPGKMLNLFRFVVYLVCAHLFSTGRTGGGFSANWIMCCLMILALSRIERVRVSCHPGARPTSHLPVVVCRIGRERVFGNSEIYIPHAQALLRLWKRESFEMGQDCRSGFNVRVCSDSDLFTALRDRELQPLPRPVLST